MEDYYLKLHPNWWKLKPNERRTLRQEDIFKLWKEAGARGFLMAVTGFGKTRLGMMAIEALFARNTDRIVNIIVPHNAAKEVWERVKEQSENKRIRICMAATYLKRPESYRSCDLLIIDECHRFTNELAELFGKVIDATHNKWVLPLSATLNTVQRKFLEDRRIPEIARVGMKEARECNYVAKHSNWIVQILVKGRDKRALDKISKEYHETWAVFNYRMDAIFKAMAGGEEGKQTREFYATKLDLEPNQIYGLARRALNAMNSRKSFFQKAPSKIEVACQIADMFPDKNIITFGEFTDVADELTKAMGSKARSFHTKLEADYVGVTKEKRWKTEKSSQRFLYQNKGKKSQMTIGHDPSHKQPYFVSWQEKKKVGPTLLKKRNVALFEDNSKGVKVLNTAKALDEAADIENVDVAIILSYTSTARQIIQRIGRVIRFKEGKTAHIFILCMTKSEGTTQEEKWLKDALAELDQYTKIKVQHLESIDFE